MKSDNDQDIGNGMISNKNTWYRYRLEKIFSFYIVIGMDMIQQDHIGISIGISMIHLDHIGIGMVVSVEPY